MIPEYETSRWCETTLTEMIPKMRELQARRMMIAMPRHWVKQAEKPDGFRLVAVEVRIDDVLETLKERVHKQLELKG